MAASDTRLAAGLFGAGITLVFIALVAEEIGIAGASGFDWKRAVLLIAGCELVVAAVVVDTRHLASTSNVSTSITTLLSGAIADGVMIFAICAAAILVLFGNSKSTERLGYFLAILVVVPLCVTLAWRRQRMGKAGERQQLLAFATLASTAGALCLTRLVAGTGGTLSASLLLLVILLVARVALACSGRIMPAAWPQSFPATTALSLIPLLLLLAAGPFVPDATLSAVDIVVGLAAGVATFWLVNAYGGRGGLPRVGGRFVDIGVLAVCALIVIYLVNPEITMAENDNFFLGPAIDVVHGHPMLVSTFSQYGVGMMDALAALFSVVPIGYGTFSLLLSGLTVLCFVVVYVVLRLSTESRFVAVIGLTVIVILDVFGQDDTYTYYPSTGVLRFGLPWLVILCSLIAATIQTHKRLYEALIVAIVAAAAVWSGEDGVYCLVTAVALVCLDAVVADASGRERLRKGAGRVALLVVASVSGVVTFTLLTRMTTGVWANWGAYVEYIRLYTIEGFGLLPIDPWSPGLALGGMYTVSAIVIVLLALMRPAVVRERKVAFRAAAGLTAFGMLAYTYFLGRSHPNNLIHVSPPAVALLFVWVGMARSALGSRSVVAAACAATVFLGAMIVASESSDVSEKYPNTALASVLGRSAPLDARLRTLWRNPVIDPTAAHAASFVRSLRAGYSSLTILMNPTIDTEALLRLGTANAVGSSNPAQEALSERARQRISAAVRSLRPGGIVVFSASTGVASRVIPIEQYAFDQLRARFTLTEVGKDRQGLRAFRLTLPGE